MSGTLLNGPYCKAPRPRPSVTATRVAALLLATILAGGARMARGADCPPERPMRIPAPIQPVNLDKIKDQLRAYHSQSYDSDIAAVVSDAREWIDHRADEVAKPALVLDIDETSLSNWPNLAANDLGFIPDGACERLPKGPCGFNAWMLRHRDKPIAPTRALFDAAKTKGVSVFFITGRHEKQRTATIANLHAAGYRAWTTLIMRADTDRNRTTQAYKTEARSKISARGFTIIANVGDQRSDLDGGYAECTFKLPNPFYFIQ